MTTFGELCCEVCGVKGSETAMFRANPKGEKGRWRCESCMTTPIDGGVLAVTDRFTAANIAAASGLDDQPMTEDEIAWVRAQRGNPPMTQWDEGR